MKTTRFTFLAILPCLCLVSCLSELSANDANSATETRSTLKKKSTIFKEMRKTPDEYFINGEMYLVNKSFLSLIKTPTSYKELYPKASSVEETIIGNYHLIPGTKYYTHWTVKDSKLYMRYIDTHFNSFRVSDESGEKVAIESLSSKEVYDIVKAFADRKSIQIEPYSTEKVYRIASTANGHEYAVIEPYTSKEVYRMMEDFTGCKFQQSPDTLTEPKCGPLGEMFAKWVTGVFYVKKALTDDYLKSNKEYQKNHSFEAYKKVIAEWEKEPYWELTFKDGLLTSMKEIK